MSDYITKPIPDQRPDVARIDRPWGSFRQFAHNEEVTVSLMTVNAGERLSLQSHTARAELWISLDDHAIIQVGDEIVQARKGEEFWIPAGVRHRLAAGERDTQVLEVAFGNWQQADISRHDDDYQRPELGE